MTPKQLFFVYGTLKEGGRFAKRFDNLRTSVRVGTVSGVNMLDLRGFPGAIDGDGQIIGEVHEYDKVETVQQEFDYIEGYNEDSPENGLYNRRTVQVELEDGETVEATMYFFNHAKGSERVVEDGVWKI